LCSTNSAIVLDKSMGESLGYRNRGLYSFLRPGISEWPIATCIPD
jgi:hypothetical protein